MASSPQPTSDQPRTQKDWWRTPLVGLLGLMLLLFGADLFGRFTYWACLGWLGEKRASATAGVIAYGIEHLGAVLVVAMFVRYLIEQAYERHFLKSVNDELKKRVRETIVAEAEKALAPLQLTVKKVDEELGMAIRRPELLDQESRDVLTQKVLNPSFIRLEYNLALRLCPFAKEGIAAEILEGLVEVFCKTSYTVQNITDKAQSYTIEAWVDEFLVPSAVNMPDTCGFTFLTCVPEAARSDSHLQPYSIEQLKRDKRIEKGFGAMWLSVPLREKILPKAVYYVEIEAFQLMRKQDLFVWNMKTLTKKLVASVEFGGGLRVEDFDVDAREMHHVGRETFRATYDEKIPNTRSWKIDQVLLPYQGIEIWWAPKATGTVSPASATAAAAGTAARAATG